MKLSCGADRFVARASARASKETASRHPSGGSWKKLRAKGGSSTDGKVEDPAGGGGGAGAGVAGHRGSQVCVELFTRLS